MPNSAYILFGRSKYQPIYLNAEAGKHIDGNVDLYIKGDTFALVRSEQGQLHLHESSKTTAKVLYAKLLDEYLCCMYPRSRGKKMPAWYDESGRVLFFGGAARRECRFNEGFRLLDLDKFHRVGAAIRGQDLVLSRRMVNRFQILENNGVLLLRRNRFGPYAESLRAGTVRVVVPGLATYCRELWGKEKIFGRRMAQGFALSPNLADLLSLDDADWDSAVEPALGMQFGRMSELLVKEG